ncbi:calcium-transporting ATPase 1 [Clostridium pasteurianum DSM 525 = ATCC 6013]|uniref:Calcium-transporting ATPase n=1 Tax=Clostridium pasteurianum DSM 525 = ATCC 6013 TaxID=1262449 RepID=A0A0H3J4I8_CLOPA|nr:cation-transporting P-type ATPase [Clostridium pasteurianum]AJA48394.1 calcium-transporting ATPase 1 [Clostridium pasteurianum DSM 525 = ATCC 6013]AJA52382.1 calcium-transporting ATPase 1 [Clostridium pasteurianum DSM 525 = ATCC 6013]AOZ75639.1 cation-transporting ATPase [Clostridium pasteurianum DSM 525 = ATCC 6013]AOZ79435.1 cation-transporting ATPase [Clostridium pasteurianum]ELP60456.1 cation transporting ATPase [Clostridium pasteurianum DSM 525 = ATCC 6013]
MTDWCNLSWTDVVNLFQSDSNKGLDDNKVLKNREDFGSNEIKLKKNRLFIDLSKKLFKPWIIYLVIAIIVQFVIGSFISAVILLIILSTNIFIIIFRKYRNQKIFILLHKLNFGYCNVIRNGNLIRIKNTEVVVGDIITYEKGSIIPADVRITNCDELMVREESITGDQNIVEKYSAKINKNDLNQSEMKNILFKSSTVHRGSGEGIVVAVGLNTEIGKYVNPLINICQNNSSFYENTYNIQNILSIMGFIGLIIIFIISRFRGDNYNNYIGISAAIFSTLVPIYSILIVIFMYFIIRKKKKKEKIFLNNIEKIESIANTDVICMDKIGIVTKKLMILKKIYDVSEIHNLERNFIINDNTKRILEIGILCNDVKDECNYNEKDELMEKAFVVFGNKYNIKKSILDEIHKRLLKLPYEEESGIKTTINKVDKKYRAYIKGDLKEIIKKCTHIMRNGIEKEITKEDIENIKNSNISLLSEGLYVLALGYRNFNYKPSRNENIESNMVFAGLAAFDNPVMNQFENNPIERCRPMTIKPIIFTEENKLSAEAFGKKIGILNASDMVVSDVEIDYMNKTDIERAVEKVSIFSRIKAYNKLKLMNEYIQLNHKLMLIGNTIIDLPSFMTANIHISFGNKCSNIIKEISDIYFENMDFNKLLDLIKSSKNYIYIIRKIIRCLCIFSLSEFLIFILSVIFNSGIPFNLKNIFWNNIFNGFLLSIAIFFSCNNGNRDYYEIEDSEDDVINDVSFTYVRKNLLLNSILLGGITFLGFYVSKIMKSNAYETVALSILYFLQIIFIIKRNLFKNLYFNGIILIYIIINCGILYTNFAKDLFDLKFINNKDINIIVGSLVLYVLIILIKNISKKNTEII